MRFPKLSHGAVAGGHPATVEAAAGILMEGGNAIDATLAAVCTSFMAEPALTGPAGGGFMLVCPRDRKPMLLDGFARMPSGTPENPELIPIPIDFGDTIQTFHIGQASVGTPSLMAMLFEAHARLGRMPIADALAPAISAARDGVRLNRLQASFLRLLTPILTHTREARRMYAPGEETLPEGALFRNSDWANVLEMLSLEGIEEMYHGDLARAIVTCCQPDGMLTMDDMNRTQVRIRKPLQLQAWQGDWMTNPPPAMGGLLVALGLDFLERRPLLNEDTWTQEIPLALRHIALLRAQGLDHAIHEPGIAQNILETHLNHGTRKTPVKWIPNNRHGSTTHLSITDAEGTSVAITTSNGEGSGIVVPGTGIHLNNMLGEEDINPGGFHRIPAGKELPSMMAPTIFFRHGRPSLILGSGGSNRLRSAILQVALRHVVLGDSIEKAVRFPRMHNEQDELDVEPGLLDEATLQSLERRGWRIRAWSESSVYFGGVHAIAIDSQGAVTAAGDPRRGGVAWVQ